MTPAQTKVLYRQSLHEPVTIQRGTGSDLTQWTSHARVFDGERRNLVGGIAQLERKAIVDAQQLFDSGMAGDVMLGDTLIEASGRKHTVSEVKIRKDTAVVVGYELTILS